MDSSENFRRLFERIRSLGFFERLFRWSAIRVMLAEAGAEVQKTEMSIEAVRSETRKIENQLAIERVSLKNLQDAVNRLTVENELQKKNLETQQRENTTLVATNATYLKRGQELGMELAAFKPRFELLEKELREVRDENVRLRKDEELRREQHSRFVTSIREMQDHLQRDRQQELDQKAAIEIQRIRELKETWLNHEENVRLRMKALCFKNGIEYVDSVPFKGKPDNTVRINGEYVVFDAKSPGGDDLSNFPTYIRNQVESVSKYVREEDVRRELFLVVPTNTLESLEQFVFSLADYYVYIISLDALEPVLIALKKIEEYEFAEQLSPEERENICRVIGKFIHLSKRRIQIDGFFAKQFFELVYRGEAELPKDILEKVVEFERSEKLNPPIEKRAKQISTKELEVDTDKLKNEAAQRGILTQDSLLIREINKLPLYSTEAQSAADNEQGKLFE